MESEVHGLRPEPERAIDIEAPAALIARTQLSSGEIPWCEGQKTDPWDHVEAAMGLGPLLASADEDPCRETGIYIGNQTTINVWYTRGGVGGPAPYGITITSLL